MASIMDPEFQAAARFAGSLVYTDALGQKRCGLTGILVSKCECADALADGFMPSPRYAGTLSWDFDTDEHFIPSGQRPLALTAGS